MYDAAMADQARRLRRRKHHLALFSVGLLALVPAAGLLLSAFGYVQDQRDRVK